MGFDLEPSKNDEGLVNSEKEQDVYRSPEAVKQIPINEQANYKGNHTELLFSRINNPVIRKQLLDLKEENERWMAEHPPKESRFIIDPASGNFKSENGFLVEEEVDGFYRAKSRAELEAELDQAIKQQQSVTAVRHYLDYRDSYSTTIDASAQDASNPTQRDAIIGTSNKNRNGPLSETDIVNRSSTEAHEKGHVLRCLQPSEYLYNKFSPAFDTTNFDITKHAPRTSYKSEEEAKTMVNSYLFNFSMPVEIIERMSQLKNYFGMTGDEKFTPQHLEYAREHYLKDGMDNNNMRLFFDAITPKTEFAFLQLINSCGI